MTHSIRDDAANGAAAADVQRQIEREVRDIGIPPRPAILDRVHAEMNKSEPDFKLLAGLIGKDVSLAAGLIKTANSPYFGSRSRVRSVNEALLVLGLALAGRTIAGLALRQMFPHTPSLERFWSASALNARLSGWLAQHCDGVRVPAGDAYTFGLFRDCGIAILLVPFPEYRDILKKANMETRLGFTEVEEKYFPTNHTIIGEQLAESWLLPEELCLAIRNHHNYAALAAEDGGGLTSSARGLIALSQLAETLVQRRTGRSRTQEWAKMGDDCCRILAITEADVSRFYQECADVVASEE